jgi:hypothetical protein
MKNRVPVRVRLANESYHTTINITKGAFKITNKVGKNIFGKIDDLSICIEESDFRNMQKEFEEMEKWELTIINEDAEGFLVMAPNGDTQYITKQQYESIKKIEYDKINTLNY